MRCNLTKSLLACAMGSTVIWGLSACGGGSGDGGAVAGSAAANTTVAQTKARPSPTPTDPFPVVVPVDATLALASTTATGQAANGAACAISSDGSQVAFTSNSALFVGTANYLNGISDVFLKNLRTNALTRINTRSDGSRLSLSSTCVGMTPDANFFVFTTPAALGGSPYSTEPPPEPSMYVKNLRTGALTNVSPPLNQFTNVASYRFQSISEDGNRVAFIAEPTTTYLGGYETRANGPARALVRDLRSGELIDLSATVSLDVSQSSVIGNMVLSPDGTKLAFNSRTNYPAAGDTNGGSDVFLLDITSRAVTLVSPAGASPSFQNYAIPGFLVGGSKLAFIASAPTSAGGVGAYIKDLTTGATRLVFAAAAGQSLPTPLSFSGDGNLVAYTQPYYVSGRDEAVVRNLVTGQEQLVNRTAAGVAGDGESRFPLLSRDGSRVVFDSSSGNLVRPNLPTPYLYQPYVKTL